MPLDATHDPKLRSFVEVEPDSPFPIQNIPFGVFRRREGSGEARVCTAIGDYVVDLAALEGFGLFNGPELRGKKVFRQSSLNAFMALGRPAWKEARATISRLLHADEPTLKKDELLRGRSIVHMDDAELLLPVEIGDYTDFYSSRDHATNVGAMFRDPANALLPNWLHLPVGYHGRAGSIVKSGTPIRRPKGQTKADDAPAPSFGPTRALDFELEMAFVIGTPSRLGEPIPIARAEDHIFGLMLLNDWSARDIQKWEYQPLGPFLAKNFATSVSPWIVTMEALEPHRAAGPKQSPEPLEYLRDNTGVLSSFNIYLEVLLRTAKMEEPHSIARSNYLNLYWSMRQQLAHHTVNGCNVRTGDVMASGTISGPTPDSRGCMLELAWKGTQPLQLPTGETRSYLQDGDELMLAAWCDGDGHKIGFGDVIGKILPA